MVAPTEKTDYQIRKAGMKAVKGNNKAFAPLAVKVEKQAVAQLVERPIEIKENIFSM